MVMIMDMLGTILMMKKVWINGDNGDIRSFLALSCHIGASNRGDDDDVEDMYGDVEDVVDVDGYD